jgi:small subunit ribosomal protein S19
MAKEFMYMGKALNELQAMSIEDFAKLTTSRTRRSLLRGVDKSMLLKIAAAQSLVKAGTPPIKPIRTHLRHFIILPPMVGLKIAVHRGNTFEQFEVQPEMVGHRVGEYILTRKPTKHGKAGIGSTKSSSAVTVK